MTQAVTKILGEVKKLSAPERSELIERLAEDFVDDIALDVTPEELRRRVAEIESGAVTPIPGDKAMAQVRQMVASALAGANGQ